MSVPPIPELRPPARRPIHPGPNADTAATDAATPLSTDCDGHAAAADCYGHPTTVPFTSFVDTTVADFSAGTLDANTYLAQTNDGEVMLAPTEGGEFSGTALPSGWFGTPWATGGVPRSAAEC